MFPLINNFTNIAIASKAGPNNRLQIKSPSELLFLTNDFNYSYEGVTTIRGVDVDAWIAVLDQIQLSQANLTNGVVEWFFTRPGWRIISDTSTTTDPVPWQLRLSGILNYVNDTGDMVVEDFNGLYDIFVFSNREPSFDVFDVSSVCVDPEDYHILRMAVPGHERGVVDLGQFRRGIRRSITEYASIFPLQVGSIEVSDLLCAVIIQFAESTAACACHMMILVVCLHNLKGLITAIQCVCASVGWYTDLVQVHVALLALATVPWMLLYEQILESFPGVAVDWGGGGEPNLTIFCLMSLTMVIHWRCASLKHPIYIGTLTTISVVQYPRALPHACLFSGLGLNTQLTYSGRRSLNCMTYYQRTPLTCHRIHCTLTHIR